MMSTPPPPPPPPPPGENLVGQVEWVRADGPSSDIVLSSRVRLARNLEGFRFVNRADSAERQAVVDRVVVAIQNLKNAKMAWIDVPQLATPERMLLVERHLISKLMQRGRGGGGREDPRGVGVSTPEHRLSVMVNEEDHLRIQTLRPGLSLDQAWLHADAIDDELESALDFAYSRRLGYLTACPTNLGTGVRMSVMLHLPAIRVTGDIEKVRRAACDMGLTVRGSYGEASEAVGDLFQISNQITLGKPESMILSELQETIIPQVVRYERIAREGLLKKRTPIVADMCHRALGMLRSARLMTAEEAMQHLSLLRLGVVSGFMQDIPLRKVNELFLLVQPAHLQRAIGRELDQEARREARAELLRSWLC